MKCEINCNKKPNKEYTLDEIKALIEQKRALERQLDEIFGSVKDYIEELANEIVNRIEKFEEEGKTTVSTLPSVRKQEFS